MQNLCSFQNRHLLREAAVELGTTFYSTLPITPRWDQVTISPMEYKKCSVIFARQAGWESAALAFAPSLLYTEDCAALSNAWAWLRKESRAPNPPVRRNCLKNRQCPCLKRDMKEEKVHCGKPLKFGGCLLILMEVQLMYNVILVSGALHSDLTFTCLMKWSPT